MGNDRLTIPLASAAPGAKSSNAKFFSTDVDPIISRSGTLLTYQVAFEGVGTEVIQITTDGGSKWHTINYNNGIVLADPIFTLQVLIRFGGSFNIRSPTGITFLNEAIVDLI